MENFNYFDFWTLKTLSLYNQKFSRKYSDVCLPLKSRVLILQCHGKSWEVICRIQVPKAQRKVKRLSKGWARFARDNNLQLGDICLFEPLKTKKYRMNVRIIRKEWDLGSAFCYCFRLVLLGLIRVAYGHVCQPLVPTFVVVILKLLCLARVQLTLFC